MGMSMYLKNTLNDLSDNKKMHLLLKGYSGCFEDINTNKLYPTLPLKPINSEYYLKCVLKFCIKRFYCEKKENKYNTSWDKHTIKWFLFWEKDKYGWHEIFTELPISWNFYYKAKEISEMRSKKEYEILIKKEEIDEIKNKEQGRIFKGRLRQLVFEKDNFKCVYCGKGIKDGVSLEVDHIKAWEDGGKTVYDNGQTLCSDCNKGKHHIKKYNNKIKELENLLTN